MAPETIEAAFPGPAVGLDPVRRLAEARRAKTAFAHATSRPLRTPLRRNHYPARAPRATAGRLRTAATVRYASTVVTAMDAPAAVWR